MSWAHRRVGIRADRQDGRLGRQRLGPDGPVHDCDQVDDRQLQDEHQEDDLDQRQVILGAGSPIEQETGDTRP